MVQKLSWTKQTVDHFRKAALLYVMWMWEDEIQDVVVKHNGIGMTSVQ